MYEHARVAELPVNLSVKIQNFPYDSRLIAHSHNSIITALPSHQLIITNIQTKEISKSNRPHQSKIIACTFHALYLVWLFLNDKYELLVVNLHAQLVETFKGVKELRDATGIHLIRGGSHLAVVFPDNVLKVRISINTNILSTRYLSSLIFKIDFYETEPFNVTLEFNKHSAKVLLPIHASEDLQGKQIANPKGEFLYCWNSSQACIYNITADQGKILKKVATRENPVTCLTYSHLKELCFIGNQAGRIKIYSILQRDKKIIHQFDGHQRQVMSMACTQQDSVLISTGLDHTVMMYNTNTMVHMYTLSMHLLVASATILTQFVAFCRKDNEEKNILVNWSEALNNLIHIINHDSVATSILTCSPVGEELWGVVTLSNQSMYAVKRRLKDGQESIELSHIMSPSVHNSNNFLVSKKLYVRGDQQVNMLELSEATLEDPTGNKQFKVVDTRSLGFVFDQKRFKSLIQTTYYWVGEMQSLKKRDYNSKSTTKNIDIQRKSYWCTGSDKGYIFFFEDIGKENKNEEIRNQFLLRQQVHYSPVKYIQRLTNPLNYSSNNGGNHCSSRLFSENQNVFVSLCQYNLMCIWKIQDKDQGIFTLLTIDLPKSISILRLFNNQLVFGLKSGVYSVFTLIPEYGSPRSERDLEAYEQSNFLGSVKLIGNQDNDNLEGHERQVVAIDCIYYSGNKLYLSAGQEKTIRIWTPEKILLVNFRFFNEIETIAFTRHLNSLSMYVSHEGKLSIIKDKCFRSNLELQLSQLSSTSYNRAPEDDESKRSIELYLKALVYRNRKVTYLPPVIFKKNNQKQEVLSPNQVTSPISPRIPRHRTKKPEIEIYTGGTNIVEPDISVMKTSMTEHKRLSNKQFRTPRYRIKSFQTPEKSLNSQETQKLDRSSQRSELVTHESTLRLPTIKSREKEYEFKLQLEKLGKPKPTRSHVTRMKILLESLQGYRKTPGVSLSLRGKSP